MYKLLKAQIVSIPPRKAVELKSLNTFPRQRPLNKQWQAKLEREMENGTFLVGEIAVALIGGVRYLLNGQHQCGAVVESGQTITATYEEYSCEDMNDVSLLYSKFDNHRRRTMQNLISFEMEALGLTWSSKVGVMVVAAASFIEGIVWKDRDDKIPLLKKYIPHGEFVHSIIFGAPKVTEIRHLTRYPVVQAMMLTWDKCHKDAEMFWEKIRDGEGLSRKMPQYVLREWLKSTSFAFGRGAMAVFAKRASAHEICSRCVTGWNAFRQDTTTALKYYPEKPIPKVL